jgi:hypothetical protein
MKETLINTDELNLLKEKAQKWDEKVQECVDLRVRYLKGKGKSIREIGGTEVLVSSVGEAIEIHLVGNDATLYDTSEDKYFSLGKISTYGDLTDIEDLILKLN